MASNKLIELGSCLKQQTALQLAPLRQEKVAARVWYSLLESPSIDEAAFYFCWMTSQSKITPSTRSTTTICSETSKIISSPTTFGSAWRVNVSRSMDSQETRHTFTYTIYTLSMQKVIQYFFEFFERLANVRPLERAAWRRDLPRPTLQLTFLESHITFRSTCCSAWSTYMFHPTKGSHPKNSVLSAFRLPTSSGGSCPISRRMSREAKIDTLFFATFARCQDQMIQT